MVPLSIHSPYIVFKLTFFSGRSVIIKWRGKPVFIRHRTPGEIEEANQVDVKTLRDPQTDDERVQRPEWWVETASLVTSLTMTGS